MAKRNRNPNHIKDLKRSAIGNSRSEGNMAQIEEHPQISKTAESVLGMLKNHLLGSYKVVGVASSLLFASSNAFSLGLGVLNVESNLDQPLNGLITVNVAPGDDVSTLQAAVASREEFEKLGIDYPEYLKDVQLDVERSGQGAVLRVSSNGVVIKEPFIHFLVKITWSGGNFLREYTALIDPPVYAAETPKSVSRPRTVGTDQAFDTDLVEGNTVETEEPVYEAPVLLDAEVIDEAIVEDVSSDVADAYSGGSSEARYGPVASGESLSVIAQELQRQVPDLSVYAIMKVLFEENQSAFIDGNINGLLQGSILDVGDLDKIRATDLDEARAFFQQQVAEWDPSALASNDVGGIGVGQDTYTSDSDLFGGSTNSNFGSAEENDNFQIGASTDTETFVSAGQGTSNEGEVLALRQQISQLQTSLASSELENQEFSERISILEGQLEDMNKIISLDVENADLAAVESTLASQNNALNDTSNDFGLTDNSILTDSQVDTVDDSGELNDFLSDDGSTANVGSSTDDLLNEFLNESGDDTGIDNLSNDELVSENLDATPDTQSVIEEVIESEVPVTQPVVTAPAPAQSSSLLDKVGGLMPVLGGLGALLIAGLGLFVWRRRRADEEFEISMLSIESNSQSIDVDTESGMSASISASVTASVVDGAEGADGDTADKETSFLTVYSDSDAVVQADEVDPIAEADVYIAYGRDEQAEEVLLDGVAAHPDRVDVKHKLIGLYFKNKNAEGFERIAEELYAQRDSMAGETWQEISDMGKELVPENPLFSLSGVEFDAVEQASEATGGANETDDSQAQSDDEDLVFESADETNESGAATTADVGNADVSEMIVDSLNEDASIQLINFDDGRSEISELDEVEINALAVEEGDDGVLEFNPPASEIDTDNDLVEVDLSEEVVDLSDDLASDDLVFDFGADSGIDDLVAEVKDDDLEEFGEERKFSEVPEVSDLVIDPEYDESQTQYELAKVFVDLGDDDGARKILEDLIANKDNSDELIANAKELLDSMNS